ncbi:flavoprotein [Streptomyces sp. NPDC003753]
MQLKQLEHVVVGVCGSSSAQDIAELVLLLRKYVAHKITALCTPAALKFVAASGVPFVSDQDWLDKPIHTLLGAEADEFIIAPATANTLAKCALGIADNLVTTSFLAYPGSAVFVPGTNRVMWESTTTQRHVAELRSRGHVVLEPGPALAASTGVVGDAVGRDWRSVVAEIIELRSLY